MLHIDQGGHFVLLATGTDGIHVHDTYLPNIIPGMLVISTTLWRAMT